MNKRHSFVIQNTIFGIFVGASFVLTSYLFFQSGQSVCLNQQLNNVIMLLSIAGAFIGTRKYREELLGGIISYGKALGSCIYILSIASAIYAIYTYLLFQAYPELQENYLQTMLSILEEVYKGIPELETMKTIISSLITSSIIAISEFFNKILTGFMYSLLLALILRRKASISHF